jgi:hypothetical protein
MFRFKFCFVSPLFALACASPPPCPNDHYDGSIAVPETDATVTEQFRISAHLQTPGQTVGISIEDNQGTVQFGGSQPLAAFVYGRTEWPQIQRTLFQGVGVGDDAWYPFWLYCTADGRLTSVFWETTNSPGGTMLDVDGSCVDLPDSVDLHLHLPAHHLNNVAMTCGFSVLDPTPAIVGSSAPELSIQSSQPGQFYDGDFWTVLPFSTVDCRWGCSDGRGASWYEIHTIMWNVGDPASSDNPTPPGQVAFTIFYLPTDGSVRGIYQDYGVVLPEVGAIGFQDFPAAAWTISR